MHFLWIVDQKANNRIKLDNYVGGSRDYESFKFKANANFTSYRDEIEDGLEDTPGDTGASTTREGGDEEGSPTGRTTTAPTGTATTGGTRDTDRKSTRLNSSHSV